MTTLFFVSLALFLLGGTAARARRVSYLATSAGALVTLVLAAGALGGGRFSVLLGVGGGLAIGFRLDHLSALFLAISSLAWLAVSLAALRPGATLETRRAIALNLASAGLLILLAAADVVTFLVGWEIMTVFAFLLIVSPSEEPSTSFRFLAFGELSSVLLAVAFAALFSTTHTLSLAPRALVGPAVLVPASIGVIVKMDVAPFHTWMRAAYERLPGFAAAFMSVGVTLAGVYGLERILAISGYDRAWVLLLMLLGAFSTFWGALQSAVSRGLRNVPSFSTTEYNGMILFAVALSTAAAHGGGGGLAYLSRFAGAAAVVLALAHALGKSLFFISVGRIADPPGAVRMSELSRVAGRPARIPAIGLVLAGLSFAAFPPLLGFIGEWMLLETAFQSYELPAFSERFVASLSGVFLALAIGLAVFAMVRYLAYVVRGAGETSAGPRPAGAPSSASAAPSVPPARQAAESADRAGAGVQIGLATLLLGTGIALPALLRYLGYGDLFGGLLGVPKPLLLISGIPTFGVLSPTMFAVVMLVLCALPFAGWLMRWDRTRRVDAWHGGLPIASGERFSSDAFAQILAHVLRGLYRTRQISEGAARTISTRDVTESLYHRLDVFVARVGAFVGRVYMNGRIGWYVTYILVAFIIVLVLATA